VLLRFADGQARQAAVNRFRRSMTGFCSDVEQSTCVVIGQRPNGLTNYASIDGIPEVLAALLAALGTAVLGQVAVVSGRRRRHEFAILKALGLLRRQIREISAWQVSILAGLALLIGLPLGLAAGRWSWQLFGAGLGVAADARVPVTLVLVMVPAVLVIANLVAWWPGRSAARILPARALRTE
jgi:predicted lysophospholipase L1 biosynthesis ABC-type transport system permease subunit